MDQVAGRSKFRKEPLNTVIGPSWLFLPDLRLLIGDGVRFIYSVNEAPKRIDDWVYFGDSVHSLELEGALAEDYRSRRIPNYLSTPTMFTNFRRTSRRLLPTMVAVYGHADWVPLLPEEGFKNHVLNPGVRDAYRIQCAVDYHGRNEIMLHHCTRALKAEYRQQMEELGIPYVPGAGIGSRRKKPVGGKRPLRPENEHAFAVWVSERKDEYIAIRRCELIDHPESRPNNFRDLMDSVKRSRDAEVERGKVDGHGDPQVPLTEQQLVERAAGKIAKGEASQSMFDILYEPAISYDISGRITIY